MWCDLFRLALRFTGEKDDGNATDNFHKDNIFIV